MSGYFFLPSPNRPPSRLAQTGVNETQSPGYTAGHYISIIVGDTPVRIAINAVDSTTNQVAVTDLLLPAYSIWSHQVEDYSTRIHAEAGDGASAYELWVWDSGTGS